jgi:WhiB family redox-sensing transcriptional regulator
MPKKWPVAPSWQKAICAGCLVRRECLDYAMSDASLVGVWGGTSDNQRAAARRRSAA